MAKTITTRLPDEYVLGLGKIARAEKLDVSSVVRKLLASAISDWKKNYAAERYIDGDFSFEQAAKFAEISVWDFPNLLKQKKVSINYDEEELESDLKTILWKKK